MTNPSDLDPLRFATITTNGFGPITSLFAVKEAAASIAIDRHDDGQTMPWPPRPDLPPKPSPESWWCDECKDHHDPNKSHRANSLGRVLYNKEHDPDGGFDDGPGGQMTHGFEEDER